MSDTWTVACKEWRELFGQRGMQGRQGMLLFIGAFGLLLPLMNGRAWIASPVMAAAWSWVPMFLVTTVIADAFAGERERHTLETLLATRLSEPAILFGKMGAAIGYAAALCGASVVLGILAVNVADPEPGLILYKWPAVVTMLVLGSIGAVFVASIGALISLRSPTVRQAQQTLGGVILVLFVLPVAGVRWLPDAWTRHATSGAALGAQLAVGLILFLVLVDAALVWLALSRFRRDGLIARI